jgi:hypothetical protein
MARKISKIQKRLNERKRAAAHCNAQGNFTVLDALNERRNAIVYILRKSGDTTEAERARLREMLQILDKRIAAIGKVPDAALVNFDILSDLSPKQTQKFIEYTGPDIVQKDNNMWKELKEVAVGLDRAIRESASENAGIVVQAKEENRITAENINDVVALMNTQNADAQGYLDEIKKLVKTCDDRGPHVAPEEIAEFLTAAERMHTLPQEVSSTLGTINRAILRRLRSEAMDALEAERLTKAVDKSDAILTESAAVVEAKLGQISEGLEASFDHPQAEENLARMQATTDADPTQ